MSRKKLDMHKWNVENVTAEFSEWVGETAYVLIRSVMMELDRKLGGVEVSYKDRMFSVRQILKDKYGYKDIPFKRF